MTLDDFLNRLKVEVRLSRIEANKIERVTHLIQQAAFFNLTAVERASSEILDLTTQADWECLAIEVSDRSADYGVSGALLCKVHPSTLIVDTFALNCKVLGKNVEYLALRELGPIARRHNCSTIDLQYRAASRNKLAGEFIKKIGGELLKQTPGGFSLTLPVEAIETLAFPSASGGNRAIKKSKTSALSELLAARRLAFAPAEKSELITNLARNFQSGEQVLAAIRVNKHHTQPAIKSEFVAPRTPTEEVLAGLWAESLALERVGIHDSFFALGGHSLLATQLISKVHRAFQVKLSPRILFESPTVADLAEVIIKNEAKPGQTDKTARLLKRIKGMSAQEIREKLQAKRSEGVSAK